jgi:hypothetical protein
VAIDPSEHAHEHTHGNGVKHFHRHQHTPGFVAPGPEADAHLAAGHSHEHSDEDSRQAARVRESMEAAEQKGVLVEGMLLKGGAARQAAQWAIVEADRCAMEAREWRAKAASCSDVMLRTGYSAKATELERRARELAGPADLIGPNTWRRN